MGNRALEFRIKKLQAITEQQETLKKEADVIKDELKKEMERRGADELQAGDFIIRWKNIISNTFDTKRFQLEHSRLYAKYIKTTESRRFTVV